MRENKQFGGSSEQSGAEVRAMVRSRGRNTIPATRQDYLEIPPYVVSEAPAEKAVSGGLLEYWRILRRRKGMLLLSVFLGGLVGFLVTLPQTPIYQAKGVVEIL